MTAQPLTVISSRFISELAGPGRRGSRSSKLRKGSSKYRWKKETVLKEDFEDGQTPNDVAQLSCCTFY
jgi:hypothetical protein